MKILLIVVLSLIGLALFLVLLALLAPFRYKAFAQKDENIFAKLTVRWLGFVLCFKLVYDTDGLDYKLRLFGGTLYGNNKQGPHVKRKDRKNIDDGPAQEIEEQEIAIKASEDDMSLDEAAKDFSGPKEEDLSWADDDDKSFLLEDEELQEQKQNFFTRIGKNIDRLFKAATDKVTSLKASVLELKKKKDNYLKLYNNVRTKETIRLAKKAIIAILKSFKPQKLRGKLLYGTGDPASTGMHMAYMSVLFPIYYDNIDITPDFQEKVLTGDVYIKGRIRLISIVVHCLRFILNKNVRITIKRFKKIKGGN